MSSILPDAPGKKKVIIYCTPNNTTVKDFAGKIRNSGQADTTIVWAKNFKGEQNVLTTDAVIIQHDAPNADVIARMYGDYMPDCEIHYMDSEGNWHVPEQDSIEPPITTIPDQASGGGDSGGAFEGAVDPRGSVPDGEIGDNPTADAASVAESAGVEDGRESSDILADDGVQASS